MHDKAPAQVISTMGRISAVPLQQTIVGGAGWRIRLLAAGMGILLLIGCANLASATMARNVTRRRELALRSALGAARRRIIQQLAVESLVVSVTASLAGLGVAAALLRVIARFGASHFPRLQELAIDARTVAFATALAAAAAVFIGVLPALQAAHRCWPGQDPIGQRFRAASFDRGREPLWFRIIGVVGDMRTLSMETRYQPIHYVNARQQLTLLGRNTTIARGSGPASALLPGLRAALREVDPEARGITMTVDEMVQEVTLERRQAAGVLAGFAALALLLAGIGIYGVLAYSVAQRLREIGIRMALGASAGRVVRHTLAGLGAPVVAGIIGGLIAARAASGVFTALVFGIAPTDPLVLGSAAAAIVMLALLAAHVPARRAA